MLDQHLQEIDWKHTTLVPNDYLNSIGFVATSYQTLCCQTCFIAVPPSQVAGHLANRVTHPDVISIDKGLLQLAIAICDISSALPSIPAGIPPLAGLCVYKGVCCTQCNYASPLKDSLATHCTKTHQSPMALNPPTCHLQQLTTHPGIHRAYFKVLVPSSHVEEDQDTTAVAV